MPGDKHEQEQYEAPMVTDYGTIEDLTKGDIKVSLNDLPAGVGTNSVTPTGQPTPPGSEPL